MATYAVVPSYQPDGHLVEVVGALAERGLSVVVVDDGSGSGYQAAFDAVRAEAVVLVHPENLGKGAALKTGFAYVREHAHAGDVVATADGDGQHDPDDVLACAREAAAHPGSLVLGRRDFSAPGVPRHRRVANRLTCGLFRLATGRSLGDTQTGLRAFGVGLLDLALAVSGSRYDYETNALLACVGRDVPVVEVPIATIYEGGGASHFRPLRDSLLVCRSILAFALSSFASFLVDYGLFALLSGWLAPWGAGGVACANVLARLGSASLNYSLNRSVVFRSEESVAATLPRYALLAACILAVNTAALELLVGVLGANALLSKLVVELALFVVSWTVQGRSVFVRKGA